MHLHQDALNGLAAGAKRWFLSPPNASAFGTRPALEWFREEYPALLSGRAGAEVLECMQWAGDAVYVPKGWGHTVLNTRPVVGVATNFEQPFSTY